MQVNEKNQLDTRKFTEIFSDLSKNEKTQLFLLLLSKQVVTSRQAVWMWSTGRTKPHIFKQPFVAKALNKITGKTYNIKTLFPIH